MPTRGARSPGAGSRAAPGCGRPRHAWPFASCQSISSRRNRLGEVEATGRAGGDRRVAPQHRAGLVVVHELERALQVLESPGRYAQGECPRGGELQDADRASRDGRRLGVVERSGVGRHEVLRDGLHQLVVVERLEVVGGREVQRAAIAQ